MRRHRYLLERGAADAPAEAEGEGCGAPEGSKRGPLCVCCRRRRPHRDWLYESYYCMSQQHPLLVFLLLIVIGACLALLAVFFFASGLVSCLSLRVALFGGQRNLPPPRGSAPCPSESQTDLREVAFRLALKSPGVLAPRTSTGPRGLAQLRSSRPRSGFTPLEFSREWSLRHPPRSALTMPQYLWPRALAPERCFSSPSKLLNSSEFCEHFPPSANIKRSSDHLILF